MASPVLIRIAGLPAASLESFGGETCLGPFDAWEAARRELAAVRTEMVAALHEQIPNLPPELRRLFLAVKRDCHNGRPLRRHRAAPEWEEVRRRTGPLADRLAGSEEREWEAAEDLDRAFAGQRRRELRALWQLAREPGFQRGLALASPPLLASLEEHGNAAGPGPRERRLALGLLRYVSRAALKLSPFSTFTRVAPGEILEMSPGAGGLQLLGDPAEWRERSLVRLRRYLVEQIAHLLLRCPAVRERSVVRLNPAREEMGPGLWRLLQPGSWIPGGSGEAPMAYRSAAVVEIPAAPELVAWLDEITARGDLGAGDLEARLAEVRGGPREEARALLDKLLQMGLLVLEPLWAGDHPRLEEAVAEALLALPSQEGPLAAVAAGLRRIVELEEAFSRSAEPAGTVEEVQRQLEAVWNAALAAAGLEGATAPYRNREIDVFEDVVATGDEGAEVAQVARSVAEEALSCAAPWLRLMDLLGGRREALHSLAGVLRRRWPDQEEVSALALYQEIHGLLPDGRGEEIDRIRNEIWRDLPGLVHQDGEEGRIDPGELTALLARVPPGADPGVGPCVFLQPADALGRLWVINRIFEGTGRYGSRFIAAMPPAVRRRLTEQLAARSGALVDLFWPHGDTLNVHAFQTARAIVLPGDRVDLPAERRVELRHLRVRIDPATGLPWLAGAAGERIRPVYLGGSSLAFAPPLIRFLALFGPGELKPIPLPRPARNEDGIQILDRLLLGRLVLGRKRWIVPAGPLRERLAASSPSRACREVLRWWRGSGLPSRVFVIERVHHESQEEAYKPQLVELASPLFFQLFAGIVHAAGSTLTVEEVLPGPEAFPQDAQGRRWAVEVQVDALAVG
ncbi:MAG TPA: lantibiotic dehydratase [Thermoanaerobaculia bacterium]|nr:lantibiotic dehydratase [Thermoanaerobaculia bacterium]